MQNITQILYELSLKAAAKINIYFSYTNRSIKKIKLFFFEPENVVITGTKKRRQSPTFYEMLQKHYVNLKSLPRYDAVLPRISSILSN